MTLPPAAFRSQPAACLLATALILVASGCGEEGSAASGSTSARQPATKAAGDRQAGCSATGCPKQLGAFVDSLDDLRRRLAAGLSYEVYVARVTRLRGSYAEIPVDRLTFDCLATGTRGEQALNKHIDAANAWGGCLADAACTTATIEPLLQRKWRSASRYLSEAR